MIQMKHINPSRRKVNLCEKFHRRRTNTPKRIHVQYVLYRGASSTAPHRHYYYYFITVCCWGRYPLHSLSVSHRPFSPIVVSLFFSRQTAWQGCYNENRKVHVLSSIVRGVVYLQRESSVCSQGRNNSSELPVILRMLDDNNQRVLDVFFIIIIVPAKQRQQLPTIYTCTGIVCTNERLLQAARRVRNVINILYWSILPSSSSSTQNDDKVVKESLCNSTLHRVMHIGIL